jgi:putative peptidoglycan binding protein
VSNDLIGTLLSSTTGGVSGKHAGTDTFSALVGPSTGSEFNTLRLRPIPIACWRVDDVRFGFDSSVVLPEVKDEMQSLAQLIAEHTQQDSKRPPPISLFGHADPVNNDDYNKLLSGRRAAAIYGMLTRREEVWEDLFSNTGVFAQPVIGDKWGNRSIQIMLNELDGPVDINGQPGPQMQSAVQRFQSKNALAPDGNPGPATRKRIFLAYMDALCIDGAGKPFKLDKAENFLARNDDPGGKGDFQGCGEFNPVLIFSQQKNVQFENAKDKTIRNSANAPNRRVMALLFRPGSRVLPSRWPCPRAKEGVGECRKRFFSDGEKRRNTRLLNNDRKFSDTKDTFACRFYDRLNNTSPCDRLLEFWVVRLLEAAQTPVSERRPLANLPFSVKGVGGGIAEFRGTTDADGVLRIPVRDNPAVMQLLVAGMEISVLGGSLAGIDTGATGILQRLSNLGFGRAELEQGEAAVKEPPRLLAAMRNFQELHGLPLEDTPSPAFRSRLQEFHGS